MTVNRPLRFLVCDAYPREGRDGLRRAAATSAGTLYERLLHRLEPAAAVYILYPADVDVALPSSSGLTDYDGVVWTGSSLTIYHDGDARVRRQIDLARAVFDSGIPSFGSCWAAQLSVIALGGRCAANPKGREFGISRRIALTAEGRAHPMYRGKLPVFDAFTSHADEVTVLPPTGLLLASNDFSRVQAVAVESRGAFWAVQYHPEYDLHEIARLSVFRMDELVRQGTFRDRSDAEEYVQRLEVLHRDPTREDIRRALGVDGSLLDDAHRTLEARNWIDFLVKPSIRG